MHRPSNESIMLPLIALVLGSVFLSCHHQVTCDQVYQPVPSEIDRFKMIQEKIQQQQEQEQQEQQEQQPGEHHRSPGLLDSAALGRHQQHPLLAHLINRLTGQTPVQFFPQESQVAVQHHLPEGVQALGPLANHLPVLPQFPQVSHTQQQLAQQQSQQHQMDPSSSLQNAPSMNPDSFRMLMHKNFALPGEVPTEMETKHFDRGGFGGGLEGGLEAKHHDDFAENKETRDDRHHQQREQNRAPMHGSRRCYACSWSIAQCADFNCYNNPDICTNNRFKPHRVHQEDCPSGCEQYVVTDPNGLIQTWKRGCAPPSLPIKGYRCKTHYEFGIRIDRCICNYDWCNWAPSIHHPSTWLLVFTMCLHWLLSRLF